MKKNEHFLVEYMYYNNAKKEIWARPITYFSTREGAREAAWCHLTKHEVRCARIIHVVSESFVLATVDKDLDHTGSSRLPA